MVFEEVKARLVANPLLVCPDFSRIFTIQTDVSDYGIGETLTQDTQNGVKSNLLLEPNVERRGETLFNNGEAVLGNCLGDPKAQSVSGRLPL